MDAETKECIDALLSGPKRRSAHTRPPKATPESYYERPERTPCASPVPKPAYCFNPSERELVDLKDQIATLSVDTASASIIFKAPINDALISRIENAIPVTQREWLEDKRAWRFAPACLNILKIILKDTYKDIQTIGVPKAIPATKFDQLMSKLSKDDKASIYAMLAKKYHPDKGGSHEVMTLINTVFRG